MKNLLVFCLLAAPGFTHADVPADIAKIQADQNACTDQNSSTVGMKNCAGTAYSKAQALLTKLTAEVTARLQAQEAQDQKNGIPAGQDSNEVLRRLQDSQTKWEDYATSKCDFNATEMLGGTGEGLIYIDCLAASTLDRVKDVYETTKEN
jgi:uncharacterized protein YecT (DUF1311 family)